jgi:hypothetical protein
MVNIVKHWGESGKISYMVLLLLIIFYIKIKNKTYDTLKLIKILLTIISHFWLYILFLKIDTRNN